MSEEGSWYCLLTLSALFLWNSISYWTWSLCLPLTGLATWSPRDLHVSTPFSLGVTRASKIHQLVTWVLRSELWFSCFTVSVFQLLSHLSRPCCFILTCLLTIKLWIGSFNQLQVPTCVIIQDILFTLLTKTIELSNAMCIFRGTFLWL